MALRFELPSGGLRAVAGEGVGVVTLPGLPVSVGEPAINPGPRKLISALIAEIAHAHGDGGDLEVTISIPGDEALAKKTGNAKFAWDSYRRFLQMYGSVVMGVEAHEGEHHDPYEVILDKAKKNKAKRDKKAKREKAKAEREARRAAGKARFAATRSESIPMSM